MSAVIESPPFFLRPMTESDLNAVMKIENANYNYPWTRQIFVDCIRVGYVCHICEFDREIAGYCIMSTGASEAHILNLCIAEEQRRKGLARHLLTHMIKMARQKEVQNVYLEVRPSNTAAINLYDSLGFNEIGVRKDYYPAEDGREDAIILARSLEV